MGIKRKQGKVAGGLTLRLNSGSMVSEVEPLTKKQIRSRILMKLRKHKEGDREQKSKIIKNKLFKLEVFKKAKYVMFYIAFDGEVDTKEMIKEARKLGKIIAVPVCRRAAAIRPCILEDLRRLKKGLYGICEPAMRRFIDLERLDLVIMPGIAFDKSHNRLGRGKCCYDRFLRKLPVGIPKIGLAFDFQILPSIPATRFDVKLDKILFA